MSILKQSERLQVGCYVQKGLEEALEEARRKIGMNRSEYLRFCLLRELKASGYFRKEEVELHEHGK